MPWSALLLLQLAADTVPRDINAVLRTALDRAGIPALGAAVVTSRGVKAIGAVGRRSWSDTVAVTTGDRWHIGSCTKTVTATLVARLVEKGLLKWTTTVGEVFRTSVPSMADAWSAIPIEWLFTHRAGLARNFPQDLWERVIREGGPLPAQRRRLVMETITAPPSQPPNTVTEYSNAGVIIAGSMLEALTGLSWEELGRREVFEPLGMHASGFGAPGTPDRLDQPLGHRRGAPGWEPVPPGPAADNPPVTGPTGTIHVSLDDWARFVSAHLRGARGDRSYLTEASWRRLHTRSQPDWEYSPGWVNATAAWASGPFLRHLGSNNLWIAEATMSLGDDVAILLVTNVSDDAVERPFRDVLDALARGYVRP
jgi:CubicO group peptidase (beta-lactamase class C family)